MKKIVIMIFGVLMTINTLANTEEKTKSIQSACSYDKLERSKNLYVECFQSDEECLNSPLWTLSDKVTAYLLVGGFGYSCNYTIDKQSGKILKFQFTDPGE
jgi:hypothetical protein